ncbi:MAG: hypothetical protein KJ971_03880 [Firmicutes bacterium]|nr:hypothetical protein [Bacillota bacterium]
MKKAMCVIFCLAFLFTSYGCELLKGSSDLTQLSAPVVTSVDSSQVIHWNSISNASGYVVRINTVEGSTTELSYSISSLIDDSQTVVIKVKAKGSALYSDSEWSSEYTFDFVKSTTIDENDSLRLTGIGQSINVVEAGYVTSIIYDAIFDKEELSNLDFNETDPDSPNMGGYYSETSISGFNSKTEVTFGINKASSKETKKKFTNNGFSLGVSATFDYKSYSNQFYYTTYQFVYTKVLSLDEYATNMNKYSDMLSDNFIATINGFNPDTVTETQLKNFFKVYGTHIITSAVYGGSTQAYYSVLNNSVNIDASLKVELEQTTNSVMQTAMTGGVSSLSASVSEELGISNEYFETTFYASFKGGNVVPCTNEAAFADSLSEWTESFNNAEDKEDKSVIVGISEGGLYPIWELLRADYPALAEKMEDAYADYSENTYNEFIDKFAFTGIEISTASDLSLLRTNPSGSFILMNDIDLNNSYFTPIESFQGTFDGNGKTISNFLMTVPAVDNPGNFGLFKTLGANAHVYNLTISDVSIVGNAYQEGTYSYIGALAGVSLGKIENVTVVSSDIAVNRGKSAIGGIVGSNEGEITDSYVSGLYLFNNGDIGGIAGISSGTINNSEVDDLEIIHWGSKINNSKSIGGLVGFNTGVVQNSGGAGPISMEYKGTGTGGIWPFTIYITPKFGFVVGNNGTTGVLNSVYFDTNSTKTNTGGCSTDYYFAKSNGAAGKNDGQIV